jgi:hypothetical protein
MAKINIDVLADTAKAEKSMKKLGTAVKVAVGAAGAFFAAKGIKSFIDTVTDAAAVQEDAINALNTSLKLSGKYSDSASKDFQAFASSIQNVTKFGDEALLQNAALIQSLGQLETEGLKKATQASADLAAAMGIDLQTAGQLMGKVAAGQVTALSRYGIALKKTGDKQADFENALQKINEQFGGAAAAQVNTYSGAMQQLSNSWGDLLEELGFFITKSPVLISAVKELNKWVNELITSISDDRAGIMKAFGESFVNVADAALTTVEEIIKVVEALTRLKDTLKGENKTERSIEAISKISEIAAEKTGEAVDKLKDLKKELAEGRGGFTGFLFGNRGAEVITAEIAEQEKIIRGMAELLKKTSKKQLENMQVAGNENVWQKSLNGIADLRKRLKGLTSEIAQVGDVAPEVSIDVSNTNWFDELKVEMEAQVKKFWKLFTKQQKEASIKAVGDIGKALTSSLVSGTKATRSGLDSIKDIEGKMARARQAGVALESEEYRKLVEEKMAAERELTKVQEEEAAKFLSSTAGSIADIFIPGAGSFVTALMDLARDPQAFEAFIEGFTAALPDLIEVIAENMPVIADSFATAMINNAPSIALSIAKATVSAQAKQAEIIASKFEKLFEDVFGKYKLNFEKITDPLDKIADKLQKILAGPGSQPSIGIGGKNITATDVILAPITGGANIAKKLGGFSEGGIVPSGFPNDSYVGRLSSHEEVVSAGDRKSILEDQGMIKGMLGQLIQSSGQPVVISSEIKLNERAFGDVILELDRNNQRISV